MSERRELERRPSRRFQTTLWSLVQAAGDERNPQAGEALARLCQTYWLPVYAYICGRGYQREDAQDLTQAFFAALIEKSRLKAADPSRGRFRSFLLASVKHFLSHERERRLAVKRGGRSQFVPFDPERIERSCLDRFAAAGPDRTYEKLWALSVLESAMDELRQEQEQAGNTTRFEQLKRFLTADDEKLPYRDVAASLGISPEAVKMAVYRLRRRFAELLRAKVEQTVLRPEQTDEEIHFLLSVLSA